MRPNERVEGEDGVHAERICETCHQSFFGDVDRCPEDGGRLVVVTNDDARLGQVLDEKVTLNRVLGRGGMGVVYAAWQHSMDREVAVKLLNRGVADDPDSVRRFLREARTASRLNHPNVITVFDFGQTADGDLYLMMELLQGVELSSLLDRGERIDVHRAIDMLIQVCDAVHHAHTNGLVHRDLKPENMFLVTGARRNRDFVKVLDFGIAKVRAYEGQDRITRTGAICGTPAYISPEQVLGDSVDARADIYALGIVLYELLTGKLPFEAETPMRQMLAHLKQAPPSFADVAPDRRIPPQVEAVVKRALAKSAGDRPPTAAALADDLTAAMEAATAAGEFGPAPMRTGEFSPPAASGTGPIALGGEPARASAQSGASGALVPPVTPGDEIGGLPTLGPGHSITGSDVVAGSDFDSDEPAPASRRRWPVLAAVALVAAAAIGGYIAFSGPTVGSGAAAGTSPTSRLGAKPDTGAPGPSAVRPTAPGGGGQSTASVTAQAVRVFRAADTDVARSMHLRRGLAQVASAPALATVDAGAPPKSGLPGAIAAPTPAALAPAALAPAALAPAAPAPAAPIPSRIHVATTPVGAIVYVDGARVGTTPTQIDRPAGETTSTLRLALRGHLAVERPISRATQDVTVVLDRKRERHTKREKGKKRPPRERRKGAGIID